MYHAILHEACKIQDIINIGLVIRLAKSLIGPSLCKNDCSSLVNLYMANQLHGKTFILKVNLVSAEKCIV